MKTYKAIIRPDGTLVTIYDDKIQELVKQAKPGTVKNVRASHVESTIFAEENSSCQWNADMRPAVRDLGLGTEDLNDPALQLGPFDSREAALAAEVNWLNKRLK